MKKQSLALPPGCILRSATAKDRWAIVRLVLGARLDPTQLRWQQFWVVEEKGSLIACGQLRDFPDAQELGSLVVSPKWRGQGIGSYLTVHLIQEAKKPLYLECLGQKLVNFYTQKGFRSIAWQELPRSLKSKFGLSHLARTYLGLPVTFMQYQADTMT
ncbi:GNAT family N-acetyltransferase [Pleurocapsales cyanobacterium LEGE 06147]|nr:GNAT family N-acetyltransferase [Pleurocapsales cyanobacterium LEGE 06147]